MGGAVLRENIQDETPSYLAVPSDREGSVRLDTAVPKPLKTPRKKRLPLPRPTKRIRAKNPKRAKSEFQRTYHSKERVAFVRLLPCAFGDCLGGLRGIRSENAHIETGGTGRKADANKIVPLCHFHHRALHTIGRRAFEKSYELNLDEAAAETEAAWKRHLGEGE